MNFDDLDVRAFICLKITNLLMMYDDPDKVMPIIATSLHDWCEAHDIDIFVLTEMLAELVRIANGIEIEGEET